jgi:FlaA1/EpsC-like NDP-sugar epimerase/ActR/RegA family two-component response regulator
MRHLIGHKRRFLLVLLDVALAAGALYASYLIRFDGAIPPKYLSVFVGTLPVLLVVRVPCFVFFGLYRGVWSYASVTDLLAIAKGVSAGSLLFMVSLLLLHVQGQSRGVLVMDWLILILLIGGSRLSWRLYTTTWEQRRATGRPVLVIGAGDAGEQVLRELQHNPRLKCRPVGLLDDNPDKLGVRIHGVPVLGTMHDIARVAEARGVEEVIIAVPSADRRAMRHIFDHCRVAGVAMKTVPGLGSLLEGTARISELREVRLEDLLRREPAHLDLQLIRAFLHGRRVLVTGAGGSIGSEICRQVAVCEPESLVLLDRGENLLFDIDSELGATFPQLTRAAVLADIKHLQPIQQVFSRYRPEIVFDAAAYKHVPLMEKHPEEAVFNNIVGTRRLSEVAIAHGVRTFVLISTDKAVNPTSVMGATKRAAERYVQTIMADPAHGGTILCAVRFGNVLGSSGSVIPTFRKQIERGGPVTVTHADITRYFMTIPEAVQLVLRAATLARGGEIFVLDMGEPVKIHDMAWDMIRLSGLEPGRDIEVAVTGLRPGEKLAEELWYPDEDVGQTGQDKLLVVRRPPDTAYITLLPRFTKLEELALGGDRTGLIRTLHAVVPEYRSANSELLSRPYILVADGDAGMREVLQGILQDGYEVVYTTDGAETIARARERVPDLVLLNLTLSRVNAYSVCQALKADPRTQRTPILLLAGLEETAAKARGLGMGADDYITKPFQADELRARVQTVLQRSYA